MFTEADIGKRAHFRGFNERYTGPCMAGIVLAVDLAFERKMTLRVASTDKECDYHIVVVSLPHSSMVVHLAEECDCREPGRRRTDCTVEDRYRSPGPANPMGGLVRRPVEPAPRPCTWPTLGPDECPNEGTHRWRVERKPTDHEGDYIGHHDLCDPHDAEARRLVKDVPETT